MIIRISYLEEELLHFFECMAIGEGCVNHRGRFFIDVFLESRFVRTFSINLQLSHNKNL